MRNIAALFLATVFGGAFVIGATWTPVFPIFEQTMRAEAAPTVRLMKGDNGGCSAVVVAPGYALTALHCKQAINPKVDGHAVAEWREFSAKDVAIVRVPGLNCPCAAIGAASLVEGERVAAFGFPHAVGLLISYGEAQGYVMESDEKWLHYSAALTGGMSGGGVFVLREGKVWLVAINSKGSGPSSLGVPTDGLQPNLKGL